MQGVSVWKVTLKMFEYSTMQIEWQVVPTLHHHFTCTFTACADLKNPVISIAHQVASHDFIRMAYMKAIILQSYDTLNKLNNTLQ